MGRTPTATGPQIPPTAPSLTLGAELVLGAPVFYGPSPVLHKYGTGNTAVGTYALAYVTSLGRYNTGVGAQALISNTDGDYNTAVGFSLVSNTTGTGNTAVGDLSLYTNGAGSFNTAVGQYALLYNEGLYFEGTTYASSTAVGHAALQYSTSGHYNVAVGVRALQNGTIGSRNVAVGLAALQFAQGSGNIGIGTQAGFTLVNGDDNILIGTLFTPATESDTIRIGYLQTRTFISGIRGVTTDSPGAVTVMIAPDGQLGTASSSRRHKEEIADVGAASEALMDLRPVSFKYRRHAAHERALEFGLVAEEVAEVMPELVVLDEEDRPETVKYRLLSVLLLNEVQRLRREMDALLAEREAEPEAG